MRLFNVFKKKPAIEPKQLYVKKASEVVKWLEYNRYAVDSFGNWNKRALSFASEMFQYCGKEKPESYSWIPEWLEER